MKLLPWEVEDHRRLKSALRLRYRADAYRKLRLPLSAALNTPTRKWSRLRRSFQRLLVMDSQEWVYFRINWTQKRINLLYIPYFMPTSEFTFSSPMIGFKTFSNRSSTSSKGRKSFSSSLWLEYLLHVSQLILEDSKQSVIIWRSGRLQSLSAPVGPAEDKTESA